MLFQKPRIRGNRIFGELQIPPLVCLEFLFHGGMALPAITAAATRAMAHEGRIPEAAPIHWDAFLEAIAREAARQHLGDWNQPDHFLLRQTTQEHLVKGNTSTLTSKERNIHRLRARELTQLIDIFAPPYTPERIKTSRWFEVDPEPWQGRGNDYLAKIR